MYLVEYPKIKFLESLISRNLPCRWIDNSIQETFSKEKRKSYTNVLIVLTTFASLKYRNLGEAGCFCLS